MCLFSEAYLGPCQTSMMELFTDIRGAAVSWLSLLHKFIQQSLNSSSAQFETLLAACRRFAMVRIFYNGPGWK